MRIKNKIQEKSDRRGPKFHATVSITSREIQRRWVLIQYSIRLQGQGSDAPYKRIGYCKLFEHEEFHTNDSFNGRVRITQGGLNLLKQL